MMILRGFTMRRRSHCAFLASGQWVRIIPNELAFGGKSDGVKSENMERLVKCLMGME